MRTDTAELTIGQLEEEAIDLAYGLNDHKRQIRLIKELARRAREGEKELRELAHQLQCNPLELSDAIPTLHRRCNGLQSELESVRNRLREMVSSLGSVESERERLLGELEARPTACPSWDGLEERWQRWIMMGMLRQSILEGGSRKNRRYEEFEDKARELWSGMTSTYQPPEPPPFEEIWKAAARWAVFAFDIGAETKENKDWFLERLAEECPAYRHVLGKQEPDAVEVLDKFLGGIVLPDEWDDLHEKAKRAWKDIKRRKGDCFSASIEGQ